jgi:hypothetical protein
MVGVTVERIRDAVRRVWAGLLRPDAEVHLFVDPRCVHPDEELGGCAVCGLTMRDGHHAGSLLDNRASFL